MLNYPIDKETGLWNKQQKNWNGKSDSGRFENG